MAIGISSSQYRNEPRAMAMADASRLSKWDCKITFQMDNKYVDCRRQLVVLLTQLDPRVN
eukprot:4593708-Pleurochrysis_carterae.AAC.8